ncbi:MAG: hypothetical protein ACPLRM_04520 [Anaerolineae bacterium]
MKAGNAGQALTVVLVAVLVVAVAAAVPPAVAAYRTAAQGKWLEDRTARNFTFDGAAKYALMRLRDGNTAAPWNPEQSEAVPFTLNGIEMSCAFVNLTLPSGVTVFRSARAVPAGRVFAVLSHYETRIWEGTDQRTAPARVDGFTETWSASPNVSVLDEGVFLASEAGEGFVGIDSLTGPAGTVELEYPGIAQVEVLSGDDFLAVTAGPGIAVYPDEGTAVAGRRFALAAVYYDAESNAIEQVESSGFAIEEGSVQASIEATEWGVRVTPLHAGILGVTVRSNGIAETVRFNVVEPVERIEVQVNGEGRRETRYAGRTSGRVFWVSGPGVR